MLDTLINIENLFFCHCFQLVFLVPPDDHGFSLFLFIKRILGKSLLQHFWPFELLERFHTCFNLDTLTYLENLSFSHCFELVYLDCPEIHSFSIHQMTTRTVFPPSTLIFRIARKISYFFMLDTLINIENLFFCHCFELVSLDCPEISSFSIYQKKTRKISPPAFLTLRIARETSYLLKVRYSNLPWESLFLSLFWASFPRLAGDSLLFYSSNDNPESLCSINSDLPNCSKDLIFLLC